MADDKEQNKSSPLIPEVIFQLLVENSMDIITLFDSAGKILYLSPAIKDVMGYEQHELLGRTVFSLIHPDDVAESLQKTENLLQDRSEGELQELRWLNKQGAWRDIEVLARTFKHEGQPVVITTTRDITSNKALLEELQQTNALFQTAFHASSNVCSLSKLESGEFIDVNWAWEKATGWSREDAIGNTSLELNIWGSEENRKKITSGLLEEGRLIQVPMEIHSKTGESRTILVDAKILMISGSKSIYLSAVDVTATKILEAQLRQSQKMEAVGQLTGGIAHDFNNLLSIIMGNSEIIKSTLSQNSELLPPLQAILRSADRGASLTQQLLAFSRKQTLAPVSVSLQGEIESMVNLLRRSLSEAIEIETNFEQDLWPCKIDPTQLENAILNLALNSRDAMPNGGMISISYSNKSISDADELSADLRAGDYVVIVFADNGLGVPENMLGQVFEPFFTTKEVGKGTGLGLSMVFGFVKQSGGHVALNSTPGTGTEVSLYLPRSDSETASTDTANIQVNSLDGKGKTVLLVEDDEDVLELIASMLERMQFDVIQAHSGKEVSTLLQNDRPIDLLLSDVILPGQKKGPEIANLVQAKFPACVALLMSGYSRGEVNEADASAASIPMINKPFSFSELANKIQQLLTEN